MKLFTFNQHLHSTSTFPLPPQKGQTDQYTLCVKFLRLAQHTSTDYLVVTANQNGAAV